jgi:hypothetical protein
MFEKPKKYISLKEAAKISGYAPDYIGSLIRNKKLAGKKVYAGVAWLTTEEAIKKYQRKIGGQKLKIKIKKSFGVIYDIIPPQKIKKVAREITGFKSYKTKGAKIFALGWRLTLLIFIILFLNGIGPVEIFNKLVGVFAEEEKTVDLYSSVCEGDWQNPQNAQWQPDVESSGDFNSFFESNSAVYKTGSLNLVCHDFKTSVEQNETVQPEQPEQPDGQLPEEQVQEEQTQTEAQQQNNEEQLAERQKQSEKNLENILDEGNAIEEITKPEEPSIEETTTPSNQETFEQNPQPEETPSVEPAASDENQVEPETTIEEPTSFFDKVKNFFGFQTTRAQEIPTFAELEKSQFRSAKIKLSFTIGEKEEDLEIPGNGGSSMPSESIPPIENTTPPASFKNKIKNFFDYLFAQAQEENIAPFGGESPIIDTVSPATEDAVIFEEGVSTPNIDAKVIIWYSFDGQNPEGEPSAPYGAGWQELAVVNSYPLSNATNSGYFTYDAPFIKKWEDFKNLRIKLEGVIGGETSVTTYLDSVWLEVNYKEEKEEFELTAFKKDWRADEDPEFEITPINQGILDKLAAKISSVPQEEPYVEAVLTSSDNKEIPLKAGEDFSTETHSPTKVKIFKSNEFRPGRYKLKITFSKNNKTYTLEKEFTWGVLAINVNKSIYLPGDEAYVQMAALNLEGLTLCYANLKLEIFDPAGNTAIFITSPVNGENEIQRSGKCARDNVTDVPDYFVYYQVGETGQYKMKLTNLDYDYEIEDYFEVQEQVPFDIERIGPTRIYPPAIYEMKFKIKANQDFTGEIVERVPASFEISNSSPSSENDQLGELLSLFSINENLGEAKNKTKLISWQVSWQNGETYELSYNFDAPDISPYLYLLGPLGFFDTNQVISQFNFNFATFKEARQWQIAADATTYTKNCAFGSSTYSCKAAFTDCATNSFCNVTTCSISCPAATPGSTYTSNNCTYSPTPNCMCADIGSGHKECDGDSGSCSIVSGSCLYTCTYPYQDCNGTGDDCESDRTTDEANCGSCGTVCSSDSTDFDGGNYPYSGSYCRDYNYLCLSGSCDYDDYHDTCIGTHSNDLREYLDSGSGCTYTDANTGDTTRYCYNTTNDYLVNCSGTLNCDLDPATACECSAPSNCCSLTTRYYNCSVGCSGLNCATCPSACGSSEDCATKTSADTDSGDFPYTAGYVTDYTGCSSGDCTYDNDSYRDACSGTNSNGLTEYLASGSGTSTSPYASSTSRYCTTTTVSGKTCGYLIDCTAGTANCNELPADLCEINTNTDNNNCGSCGNVCGVGQVCVSGSCISAITVSGNAYEDETSSALVACDGLTTMIALRIGGNTYGPVVCADADGAFTISAIPITGISAGTPMILWIDGATCGTSGNCASTVNRYSGSGNITAMEVRKNRLMIMSNSGNPTNANLDTYDNGNDTDIIYTVTTNNLTLEDGYKLIVNSGDTYEPGGTVTTDPSADNTSTDGDIYIESTAVMTVGTNAVSCGGDWTNSGTFTKSTGQTTTFTATAASHTITDGGSNFDTLVFNGTGGGWSFADSTTIDVNLTMTAGTLSGTSDITVSGGGVTGDGTITLTGGTFLLDGAGSFGGNTSWTFSTLTFGDSSGITTTTATGSGTITVSGNLSIAVNQTLGGSKSFTVSGGGATGDGTITLTGGTFLLDGTGNFGGVSNWTFYNLTFGNGSGITTTTKTGAGNVIIANVLTIADSQILDASDDTWIINGTGGTPFVKTGTLTANASTFRYDTGANTTIAAATYYNLELIDPPKGKSSEAQKGKREEPQIENQSTEHVKHYVLGARPSTKNILCSDSNDQTILSDVSQYINDQTLFGEVGHYIKENLSSLTSETPDYSKDKIPIIKNASIEPDKVKPGDTMLVTAEIEDSFGIKEVKADMGGVEVISLELKEGTSTKGKWQKEWLVHDTERREYVTIITATNTLGRSSQTEVKWADAANMILLWDGGAAPTGWTIISDDVGEDFYQRFPYGAATYGTKLGAATHTHTGTASTSGPSTATYVQNAGAGSLNASCTHTHSTSYTVSTDSNLPSYRDLKVIRYSGIPTTIPLGAIAIFDAGAPAGWTRYSLEDGYFVRGGATAGATGGSNTNHTHTVTVTVGGVIELVGAAAGAYPDWPPHSGHTSAVQTTPSASHIPPYKEVILAKANADTTVPGGMIAMFDDTPSGWSVISGSGQALYQYFIRGNSAYGATGGTIEHTHTNMSWTSGSEWPNPNSHTRPSAPTACDSRHTHTIYFQSISTVSNLPPYITVIFAKAPSVSAPTITISAATSVTSSTATLNGNVTATGGENPTVTMYWGKTDGGQVIGNWTNSSAPTSPAQPQGVAAFYKDLTGLDPVTLYYFSAKATNSAGTSWPVASLSFTTSAPTYTLASGAFVINNNLTIGDGVDAVIVTADTNDPTVDVNGNFEVKTSATFIASASASFTIAGNFSRTGTFTHSSGTVTFDDAAKTSTFSGSTTFYNLTCNTASKNLTFTASTTQTIAAGGTLTLNGQACSTQIVLRSSSTPTQWNINVPAPATVSYVDVKDSNATGSAITANNSKDSLNNTNWTINGGSCFMSVAGNAYENETASALVVCDGLTTMIALRLGGTTYGPVVCADADGVFTISNVAVPAAGTPMILWIDGATCGTSGNCASTVNRYSGSGNVTGMEVRKSRLIIMSDSGSPTNANLDTYDNGNDPDITYTVTSSNLTLEDGHKLIVKSGVTYEPGGTVTTDPSASASSTDGDILIQSTATMTVATNAVSCGGDWTNSGTFTKSTGQTTTFTATAASHTITDGGSNFDTLVFNGSSGGWSFADSTTIDVDLTMTAGTLSGTNDITVSGGDVTGNGDINLTAGTFLLDGAGNFGGDTAWDFSSLTFGNGVDATATTKTGTGSITVGSVLTIAANQTLDAGDDTWILSGTTGTPFVITGTFTGNTSTFIYSGVYPSGNTNIAASLNYCNLQINGSETYTLGGNATLSGDFTATLGTLSEGADTLTVNGGDMTGNGTVTFTGGTVLMDGAGNFGGDTAWTFYDLTFGNGADVTKTTKTGTGAITVSHVLTIAASQELDASDDTWTLSGITGTPFVKTGTFTANASTIKYTGDNGGGNTNVVSTTYYNLYLDNASEIYDAAGDITVSNIFTINAGTFDAKAITLTLSGIGTPFVKTDTFTPSTSTVKYTGNGDTNITAATYNNLELSPTITDNRAYTGAGAIIADGTLNINPTASSALALTFTLGGTTSITSSTFIQVTNLATSILDTKSGSNYSFTTGSLSIQAGGTLTGRASALDSNGDVTIAASGTLTSTSEDFNVGGSWSNSGTFTHSSGTVIFDATTTGKTITDGGSAFYDLQFTGANGGWTYTDGCSTAPNTTIVNASSGTATFINAKTAASPTVSAGTLNVDWYVGVHVVDAANTTTHIDTGASDITISENSGTPASTVWRHNGSIWGDGATSKTTGTDSNGNNPQPTSDGAIRIREYSMTNSSACPGAGCTLYKYNLQIIWQSTYGEYNYYNDYGQNYLTSCWAGSTSACSNDTVDDDVIGVGWYRATVGTMNAVGTINEPPTTGSWYCGMLKGLEVAITGTSIDFGTLDASNNFTVTAGTQTNITVTTSAVSGYIVTAWESQLMTCSNAGACGSETITNFTHGSYTDPEPWATTCIADSNHCGFGFTSSDTSVESLNRYNGATEYTFFPTDSANPVRVMDYGGSVSSQSYLITYRISAPFIQRPGPYGTTIIYVVTAQY